jgi:hypothetical protein
MKLFSAFAAATLLERDRQTISRALRSVPADGKERGQPRWKLRKIVDALAAHERPAAGSVNTGGNPPEYAAFDRAYNQMTALPTLAKRRAATLKLVSALNDMIEALRARGRAVGGDPDVTGMRGDRVYQLALAGFQEPCSWTHDQVWHNFNTDVDAD